MCARKHFCELSPVCYEISWKKEICKRHIKNFFSRERIAKEFDTGHLPNVAFEKTSYLIKKGKDIDPVLQHNKAKNIALAAAKLNGLLIHPGEVFSFWETIGSITRRKGYLDGRVLQGGKLIAGIGGGLCNLANTLHVMVLHTPLTVTEFHKHSDALAPDEGERVSFSSGTSVGYNQLDYRFRNDTNQTVQLLASCENESLHMELRSERPFDTCYEIFEEDHHFEKQGDGYYRISKIYRRVTNRQTGEYIRDELLLDNRSKVMYDPALIPAQLLRA